MARMDGARWAADGESLALGCEPANDAVAFERADEALSEDEAFAEVCDARRDAWLEAMEEDDQAAAAPRLAGGTDHD